MSTLFHRSAGAISIPARGLPRKSSDEQIAQTARRQDQLDARRLTKLATKKEADRKRDTRRKIIVGGAILARAELDPGFADKLRALLDLAVTRPVDRGVIADLLPVTAPAANAA
jgi:hypothetical protein